VINRALVLELDQIRTRDDLPPHANKLQKLFNQLVDVIIQMHIYKDLHPEISLENISSEQSVLCEKLRLGLNRVLQMEGGREVLEKAQEEALNRLDAFEHARKKPKE